MDAGVSSSYIKTDVVEMFLSQFKVFGIHPGFFFFTRLGNTLSVARGLKVASKSFWNPGGQLCNIKI